MPAIIIKCSRCKRVLTVSDSYVDSMGDIVIGVETCPSLDCRDCNGCEEVEALKVLKEKL